MLRLFAIELQDGNQDAMMTSLRMLCLLQKMPKDLDYACSFTDTITARCPHQATRE